MEKKKYASFNGISNIKSSDTPRRKSENDVDKLKEDINLHDLREKVFTHENGLKSKLKNVEEQKEQLQELKQFIENKDNKSENMFETMIKRNGTRFTLDELKLLNKVRDSKDDEYKIAGLGTLIEMKGKEVYDTKDYIRQYGDLRNSIEEATKERQSDNKEGFKRKFDMIQVTENRSQEILKMKREFEAAINNSGFRIGNSIIGTYKSVGKIRSNNFEQLQKNINNTDNKYLKLLSYIINFGAKKEKNFDKYIKGKEKSIVNCAEEFIKQFPKKTEDIKLLESKVDEFKHLVGLDKNENKLTNYIKFGKDVLKGSVKSFVQASDEQERQLKNMREIKELKELVNMINEIAENEYKENNQLLIDICKKQDRLDEVQSFLHSSIININSIIKSSMKNIQLKAYYETMLKSGLDNSISENDKVNNIIHEIENAAKEKKIEKFQKRNWSLLKKLKVKLNPVESFLKQILKGKGVVRFGTLGLSRSTYYIKRRKENEEKILRQSYEKRQSIRQTDRERVSDKDINKKNGRGMDM